MQKGKPKPGKLRTMLRKAESSWPLGLQVIGFLVACFAVGALAGAAFGWLVGGAGAAAFGALNEGDSQ